MVVRIVCVANQKGGVGKTTTAINLAYGLTKAKKRTLLVDLDPQCNATSGIGATPLDRHPLTDSEPLQKSIQRLTDLDMELLPGSRNFQDIEKLASKENGHSARLRAHLDEELRAYDCVLIDCPPSLGHLTKTALFSATEVLMPIQCEYFAMEGLTQMIHVIRAVMKRPNSRLEFGGILLTMYDDSLELTHEVDREVRDFFGEVVCDTVIPRDVAVAESPSHGQPVISYAPRSRGARAYVELCTEMLEYS